MVHARLHFCRLYYKIHKFPLNLSPLTLYLSAGTEIYEKVAALEVVHYIPSNSFSLKKCYFQNELYILTICQKSALNMPKLLYAELILGYEICVGLLTLQQQ